jgi:hypothetical protein
LTGGRLDFENGTHIPMDSRGVQVPASIAGAFETGVVWQGSVATLLAYEPSIDTRFHGPELNTEHAIGTANDFLGHGEIGRTAKAKTTLKELLVTAALPPWG